MLVYVSKRSVSVVIDEIESLGMPVARESRTRDLKGNNSGETGDDLKYNTALAGYSITIDDVTKRPVNKKTVSTRDSGTCKNCVIS